MSNVDKYNEVFKSCFELKDDDLNEKLEYQSVELWDSVGHMSMVGELEDTFDIMLEMDDIIDFSSYEKGKELLTKYGVEF
tara:strand:+ start:850 stop:1089 length:240 start_codon:yes stop_codon:yes gene_type:complete